MRDVRLLAKHGAQDVRDAIAGARDAAEWLGEQSIGWRVEAVGAVLDRLRAAESPPRRALEDRLPEATGFSPEGVRAGLALALDSWTSTALWDLVQRELGIAANDDAGRVTRGTISSGLGVASVLLGGALPMPAVIDLLVPLVAGTAVVAKPGRHDPVTAGVVRDALREQDAGLSDALAIVHIDDHDPDAVDALLEADAVVVTGSDETLDLLRPRVRFPRRFLGRGHRTSLAVLGPDALRPERLEASACALALDVALWDQLGCLSPISVYVVAAERASESARLLGQALSRAFDDLASRLPRGTISAAAAVAFTHARADAQMRAANGVATAVLGPASLQHCVVVESDSTPRSSPLHRFVRVHPVENMEVLVAALRPLAARLAGIACAGFAADERAARSSLAALGASRICAPGRLQAPPLGWHHEGQPVLSALLRFTDLET